mgnify:CR=1 FL=1
MVGSQAPDIHKEVFYQVGITPTRTERARDHCERIQKLPKEDQPLTLCPPGLLLCLNCQR